MTRLILCVAITLGLLAGITARAQTPAAPAATQAPAQSATSTPPPATAAPATVDQNGNGDGRTWLQVGSGKQPAFYLPETSRTTYGGALIVPDSGNHPENQGSINRLRHDLANNHWHTLALDISGLNPQEVQQAIAAGVAFLNGKGVFNIAIIGKGRGAAYALHYVAGTPPAQGGKIHQIRALVMINADNFVAALKDNPMAPLAKLRRPVLDAYTANNLDQQREAAARRQLARPGNKRFQQIGLPDYIGFRTLDQENPQSKRIRGWLDKNVAGYMVGGDRKNPN